MNIRFHASATTTPKSKTYIHSFDKGVRALADELNVPVSTVCQCGNSKTVYDGSHTWKNLLATLCAVQEAIVIKLRRILLLTRCGPIETVESLRGRLYPYRLQVPAAKVLASHCFDSREALETILKRYCHPYIHHITQKALNDRARFQVMKDWQATHLQLLGQ